MNRSLLFAAVTAGTALSCAVACTSLVTASPRAGTATAGTPGAAATVVPASAGTTTGTATGTATAAEVTPTTLDPATWSTSRLAAQLVFVCLDSSSTTAQRNLAAQGVGGLSMLGREAPSDIKSRLADVRAAAPGGVAPLIASDEEGGLVQRLANVIYTLPSAETMGGWTTTRIQSTANDYAKRMRALGVPMDFAPVADLGIPGYYIESQHRAFSQYPDHVTTDISAWIRGMRAAGELTVVKHWPGHGQASNTHTGAATVPPLSTLEKRDMIPFNAAFAMGVPAVMVGHLKSDGLTDPGWPATESPKALHYLRGHAGPNTLIVTDSLSMAAASSSVGLTVPQAAVRALRSGVDSALTCEPSGVIAAVAKAISDGAISHVNAVAKARRLLTLKAREALLNGAYHGPRATSTSVHVAKATVPAGGDDTLSATVSGGYRAVTVQRYTSGAWHTYRTAFTGVHGWFRVSLPTGTPGTYRYRVQAPGAFPWAAATSAPVTVTVTG